MSLVPESGYPRRGVCRGAVAGLLAAALAGSAGAQDSRGQLGDGEGVAAALAIGGESAEGLGGDEEILFADGPREPGVLSAEGTLIGAGGKKLESREEGGAVAALVDSATGESKAPVPVEEDGSEEAEVPRAKSPTLIERLGGFLGLGGD